MEPPHIIGMPAEKYSDESQASRLPDSADTAIHTAIPNMRALR